MYLEPANFNAFIAKMGQAVTWRRAHLCPNRDPDSGAPTHACRACQNGYIWVAAVTSALALSGQKLQRDWARHGLYEKGDVVCTLPSDQPLYNMGEADRVVFSQSSVPFSLPLLNAGAQNLGFVPVSIDTVVWVDADTTPVYGAVPVIGADGALTWTSGAPPDGTRYTVSGRRSPEYFCFMDYPQDRAHHGGRPLPRKVVLRAFELFGRAA